eukprot:COSAG06_NODE_1850_length_8215_cov_51.160917_6_plen_37_part_00
MVLALLLGARGGVVAREQEAGGAVGANGRQPNVHLH